MRSSIAWTCIVMGCSAGGGSSPLDAPSDAAPPDAGEPDQAILETGSSEGGVCVVNDSLVSVAIDDDFDGDGWSMREGDCDDCEKNANPGAYDVAGNGVDEDCNGTEDDEPFGCDEGIAMDSNVPDDGARAIGLCRFAATDPQHPLDRTWGVLESGYVLANGQPGMHWASRGVLPGFGPYVRPQEGNSLLALSTATARQVGDDDYESPLAANMETTCETPTGWPKDFPGCDTETAPIANDSAGLRLRLRAPTNATALSFRVSFYTTEFPSWICHQYNDTFVVLSTSAAPNPAAQDGNITFDGQGLPLSVNSAFLEVCTPQVVGETAYACMLGDAALAGNGFGASASEPRGHGATGWLETTAPVVPGETFELMWLIWDAGDHLIGSTVLVDGFAWHAEPAAEPVTVRVPQPR